MIVVTRMACASCGLAGATKDEWQWCFRVRSRARLAKFLLSESFYCPLFVRLCEGVDEVLRDKLFAIAFI
jgi:hypothetical protein